MADRHRRGDEGILSERATRQERGVVGWEGGDDLDTASSASRQHYIDTGRHLRRGEALDSDDEDVCASSDPYYCDGKCR